MAGRCQQSGNFTCGASGRQCVACAVNESCVAGSCSPIGSGAGTAGGGGAGGGSGGGSSGAYGTFLTNFSSAYCAKAIECAAFSSSAQSDCATLIRPFFASIGLTFGSNGSSSERSVSRGSATFDAAQGQACLAAIAALPCNMATSGNLMACSSVVRPNAMSGQACLSGGDCVDSSLSCNGAACGRTCTAGGNLGEACRADGTCNAPFLCRSGLCQPEPTPGTPCTSSFDCGTRATCTSNQCVLLPTAGQSCPNFRCVPEAYCDSARVCRARKASGVACANSSECEDALRCAASVCGPRLAAGSACVSTSDCVATAPCRNNRCTAPALQGQACDPSSFGGCAAGLSCDDVLRTCQPRTEVATGQACSSTRGCQNSDDSCRNRVVVSDGGMNQPGTCGPPQAGDPCTGNFECGQGRYCDMARRCQNAGPATPCGSSSNCRATDYCTSSRVCATKAPAGQVCDGTSSDSCSASGESCLATSTPGQFRCQRLPVLGQPCVERCEPFAACVGGTCVASGRQGQPCIDSFPVVPCFAGECIRADGGVRGFGDGDGTCQAPRANGQSCSLDIGCQSGFCDRTGSPFSSNLGICTAACP
jgi:hypothetical protein